MIPDAYESTRPTPVRKDLDDPRLSRGDDLGKGAAFVLRCESSGGRGGWSEGGV